MAGLRATTLDLSGLRRRWRDVMQSAAGPAGPAATATTGDGGLQPVAAFGSNPGALQMFTYVPDDVPASPAMVVVLHGCTQSAAAYAVGAGWLTLAERHGFILVCPQQTTANNPKSCFNWFLPGDTARDAGEALSIRQMVERAATDHGADRRRIFVTGLSAGGAMAAVMLATYPDVFAGGGVVAGLPYGAAGNVQQALQAMFQGGTRPAQGWGDLVRAASPHSGPWPRLSVWHGGADSVVKPGNAVEIVKQWADLHGLPAQPSESAVVDGHPRDVWRDAAGTELIESYTIAGMGHGAPLAVGDEAAMAGTAGAFLLDVGISSSFHMARFWGLTETGSPSRVRRENIAPPASGSVALVSPDGAIEMPRPLPPRGEAPAPRPAGAAPGPARPTDIGSIITDALRAAGLMKR